MKKRLVVKELVDDLEDRKERMEGKENVGRKNGKEDGGKRMVEGIVKNMMMVGKER